MKKILRQGICSGFLFFSLAAAPCLHAGEDLPAAGEARSDHSILISTGDSIRIEMKDIPLYEAINAVQQRSNIKFEVPENLRHDRITSRFTSRDWPAAIKRLLKQYNIAYGWERNELKSVFIFARGTGKVLQLVPTSEEELPAGGPTEANRQANGIPDQESIPSLPLIPEAEEQIIEIKLGAHKPGKRGEKPARKHGEESGTGLLPAGSPELSARESEDAFAVPVTERVE